MLEPVCGVVFEDEDLVEEDFEEDVVDWWICETSIGWGRSLHGQSSCTAIAELARRATTARPLKNDTRMVILFCFFLSLL